MICVFHDQASRRNRMQDPFDRSDGSGFEIAPSMIAASIRCTPSSWRFAPRPALNNPDCSRRPTRTLDSDDCRTSLLKDGIADDECISETGGLRRRHTSETGTSVGKNERRGTGQLRRRSRAWRYAGSFMRSRSDRTNPRPVTQSSKLSESFLNRGGSSPDGLSAICATIP